MADKQKYMGWLDEHAGLFADVSDHIWEYAELSLMEEKSCALYVKLLREEGFTVETPVAGIQTGFKATYGSGHPVIGILAEYDALTGLSQVSGSTKREEMVKNGTGHGCGHHMLGAGAMAAAWRGWRPPSCLTAAVPSPCPRRDELNREKMAAIRGHFFWPVHENTPAPSL